MGLVLVEVVATPVGKQYQETRLPNAPPYSFMSNIFEFRDGLISDYSRFSTSFANIAAPDIKEFVKKDEAYLKLYTRQGRADIITFIKLYDLFYLTTFQIYRHES